MTRRSKTIRLLLAVLLSLAIATAAGGPASAGRGVRRAPARTNRSSGRVPAGRDRGRPRGTIYVGSLADGSIWRGNVRTGDGAVWAEGGGTPAVGMALDRRRDLLWVAGGPTGEVRAYDVRTASLVRSYQFAGSGFLNDVTVNRTGVYATDSFVQRLAVVEFGRGGSLPADGTTVALTGDIHYVAGPPDNPAFNANGIVSSHGSVVIDQSETGQLFRVDPQTGVASEIETFGTDLVAADGMELRGHLLYVVRNTGRRPAHGPGHAARGRRPTGDAHRRPRLLVDCRTRRPSPVRGQREVLDAADTDDAVLGDPALSRDQRGSRRCQLRSPMSSALGTALADLELERRRRRHRDRSARRGGNAPPRPHRASAR